MAEHMLTTVDNPYDPFNNFEAWYAYDRDLARFQGRSDCLSYQARIAHKNGLSSQMPENMYRRIIEETIQEIVKYNVTGNFIMVTEEEAKKLM
jgi:hypothetical protein